jgi:dephospho-CoA kinase
VTDAKGMLVVGVTGGIGAGKSTAARLLGERGARVIDADAVVRELYGPGDLADGIAGQFGPGVLAGDGGVDRAALGALVFGDPDARRELEDLVHPAIRKEINDRLAAWRAEGFDGIAVVDAALLVEAAGAYPLDVLVVVAAREELRLQRLEKRGTPPDEARRRIAAQIGDAERDAAADRVLRNDGTLRDLAAAVDAFLQDLGRDADGRSG